MKRKEQCLSVEKMLKALNPKMNCAWLKELNKKEIHELWLALMSIQENEDLVRF